MDPFCTLLHISDLHFGTREVERMADAVLEAADRIRPDAVIASGDLVEWAERPSAWRGVARFFSRFTAPVLAVPGNHDIDRVNLIGRLGNPFRAYRRHVHDELDRALPVRGAHVVGLASPSRWTIDLGYLSRAQVDWAQDSFAGAQRGDLRVVVVHHGPRAFTRRAWWRKHIRGGGIRRLMRSGVDLVLTGHNHFPHAEQLADDDGAVLTWSQAGTATCHRVNRAARANSFSVVRAFSDRLDVSWWHHEAELGAFEPAEARSFPRHLRVEPRPACSPGLLRVPG